MSTPVTPNFVSSQYWYAVLAWLEKQGTPYDEKEGHRLQLSYNSANQMPNEEPMKHIARFKFSEWEHPAPQPSPEDLLQLTVQEVVNQRIIAAKFSRGRSEKYLHRLILQVANTVMPFDWNEEKEFEAWIVETEGLDAWAGMVEKEWAELRRSSEPSADGTDKGKEIEQSSQQEPTSSLMPSPSAGLTESESSENSAEEVRTQPTEPKASAASSAASTPQPSANSSTTTTPEEAKAKTTARVCVNE
jgi:hypothetical protein